MWPNVKDKSNNFWHAYSHILYEPLWKKVVPRLSTNFHINKKALENSAGIFKREPRNMTELGDIRKKMKKSQIISF